MNSPLNKKLAPANEIRGSNLRRDGVNTSVLDRLPSFLPDVLGSGLELLSGDLASPVSLNGLQKWDVSTDPYFTYLTGGALAMAATDLLHGTVDTDTGVTKDSGLDHFGCFVDG